MAHKKNKSRYKKLSIKNFGKKKPKKIASRANKNPPKIIEQKADEKRRKTDERSWLVKNESSLGKRPETQGGHPRGNRGGHAPWLD